MIEYRKEGKREDKQEIVKNLLKLNISIKDIIKFTGLDANTIINFENSK